MMADESTPIAGAPVRLRNLTPEVVSGTDAATLQAAMTTFLEEAGEANLVMMIRVADYKVLVIYSA